ncbi:nucleoside 2-deoxyribosyltransferase [Sphingobium sp. B2D3A]|nr:nucleoside 2-deoxyribosyltransferase [Sphingobium sp. B2D3A]
MVEQARKYLLDHGCEEFVLLGEVTGAPNLIAIADVQEVGHQGYEDILRSERKVSFIRDVAPLMEFERIVVFPGRYDLNKVLQAVGPNACVTLDAAYDMGEASLRELAKGRVSRLVLSTSSELFMGLASKDVSLLLELARQVGVAHLLLKENRGGSRLFDLRSGAVERITATLDVTVNSVGVGDAFTAVFGCFDGTVRDAAWRGMQVATVYSQTTWPDDLRRDVRRELRLTVDNVRQLGGVTLPWHVRPMHPIYLAAPDFSYASHREIDVALSALKYHNFRVRRPVQENGEAAPNAPLESLVPFFFKDVELLRECAAVFAIPIDRDPGTLVEMGMAMEMGKPVITYDPRHENRNTMVVQGSTSYSADLDTSLNGVFESLGRIGRG